MKFCAGMKTMINSSSCFFFLLPLFFFSSNTHLCDGADTISAGQSLLSYQTLVSKEDNFELGFFNKSSNFYVGIWHRKLVLLAKNIVWVANRDYPLNGHPSSSELKLLENGNLVLLNNSKIPIWSTNSTSKAMNSSQLVLGDDGNLVLRDRFNPSDVFWESFDHLGDTWLPGGKLSNHGITKAPELLTSWKNSDDPAQGLFSLRLDPIGKQFTLHWNRSKQYWSSGPWNGEIFSLVPEMRRNFIYNYSYISNENESYFTYSVYNKSIMTRCVLDWSGQLQVSTWLENPGTWNLFWAQPRQICEVYAACGAFGRCDQRGLPFCQCLPGFEPRSPRDWNLSDYSDGCVRKISLKCGNKDGFQLMSNMKLPGDAAVSLPAGSDEECKSVCLNNCNCSAYSYRGWCSTWNGQLLNLQQLMDGDSEGRDLHLKLTASELPRLDEKREAKDYIIVPVTIVGSIIAIVLLGGILCSLKGKKRGVMRRFVELLASGRTLENLRESRHAYLFEDQARGRESQDLPLFDFNIIAVSTNNFTDKLGQGGFGPVYKGKLLDGQEIAVKRLSRSSGQGIEEFKNEIKLISKLQHRNLVRLLGCCIEKEEKILVYEYMPYKSLDAFLFDPTKRSVLDWAKRFNIMDGIARGLLYLHRDSRLRIIHRDLKASNILLDEDMNPKISNFGMARIFGGEGDQTLANTNRVVGTYGYMSPEYAMGGIFSVKSDVFSFGVLLLEILSSRRNTSFYYREKSLNLLGYAWGLWNEGNALELIDPILVDEFSMLELMRCIHVGLLCVQEHAVDRPTMSRIVFLLGHETTLPPPKQPAFIPERTNLQTDIDSVSINTVTLTSVGGRI